MPEKKAPAKAPAKSKSTPKAKSSTAVAKSDSDGSAKVEAVASLRGTCTVEKCGRALRAKGYCRKHFMAWRREKLGAHHHYKICSKEACRKKRQFGGLCAEHAGKGAAAQPAAGATP